MHPLRGGTVQLVRDQALRRVVRQAEIGNELLHMSALVEEYCHLFAVASLV